MVKMVAVKLWILDKQVFVTGIAERSFLIPTTARTTLWVI
jgi:hypothetical protein